MNNENECVVNKVLPIGIQLPIQYLIINSEHDQTIIQNFDPLDMMK